MKQQPDRGTVRRTGARSRRVCTDRAGGALSGYEYRFDVEAEVLSGRREHLTGGGWMPLLTLRLFNGSGVVDDHGRTSAEPGAFTDLRPSEARVLAAQLLDCARCAERLRRRTG